MENHLRNCPCLIFGGFAIVRSPLVSFLYERGWRQNFNRSGFPGRDEEVSLPCHVFFHYAPNAVLN